jgi:hypothetical protein
MSDLVEETVRGIRARLKELAPVVAEYERLQAAYAALDGAGANPGVQPSVGAGTRERPHKPAGRRRAGSGSRAKRGQSKAAVLGVIAQRPGVTVAEIAQVTAIAKPLIYNTTRVGVDRGELERVALPGGHHGFKLAQAVPPSESGTSPR